MKTSLHDLLQEKKARSPGSAQAAEQQKEQWLTRLRRLYKQLETWLQPSKEQGLLSVSYPAVRLEEELLGPYQAEAMWITFYNGQVIKLIPRGLHVVGANGRVDMDLGDRQVMFLGDPDGDHWIVAETFPAISGAEWISKGQMESLRGSRPHKLPLTPEVFEELLVDFDEKF
jgi:hypothetical protein